MQTNNTGVKLDYKPTATSGPRLRAHLRVLRLRWHRTETQHKHLALGSCLLALALGITTLGVFTGAQSQPAAPPLAERTVPLPLPSEPRIRDWMTAGELEPAQYRERTLEVKAGESIASVFRRERLNRTDLHFITALGGAASELQRVRPGDQLTVHDDGAGNVLYLTRDLSDDRILHIRRGENGFEKEIEDLPLQRRIRHAEGEINRSLYQDAREAGLSTGLIMDLSHIFQWDIDFVLDIRRGDEFRVIYEALYRDGEEIGNGRILAAEIVNRGERIRALRYTDPEGNSDYYAPSGESMRQAFLRAPLEYMRISSHFNPNRRHPKLNRMRAHRGVDYAAPEGTPVRAAGDGRVTYRGRRGGYGNTVQIKHGDRYSTLYAHLSRFEPSVQSGSRVEQGDVIGYVGQTGLATGPHLHYEFLVDGVHRDPVNVELPSADPVPEKYHDHFRETVSPLIAELDLVGGEERLVQRPVGE